MPSPRKRTKRRTDTSTTIATYVPVIWKFFFFGALGGAVAYHVLLNHFYTMCTAIRNHIYRVNRYKHTVHVTTATTNTTDTTNNSYNIQYSYVPAHIIRPSTPLRQNTLRPRLWFRFPATPPSPPSASIDVKLLERMWGEHEADEAVVYKLKSISAECGPGWSLKVAKTHNGGVGAFCAPTCKEGEELVFDAGVSSVAYVCVPIRAPPPIPPPLKSPRYPSRQR